jgi:hypothetical protein
VKLGGPYLLMTLFNQKIELFATRNNQCCVTNNIMLAGVNMNVVVLLLLLPPESHAFVHPVHSSTIREPSATSSFSALPEFNPFLLADGLSAATRYGGGGFESDVFADPAVTGALSTLRTFFIVLTAAAFGLTALAYITAAVIVPAAAKQLENDTKRLRPGLWEEYEAKLEEGQTMANRPGEYSYRIQRSNVHLLTLHL